jgi:hypothetical protein
LQIGHEIALETPQEQPAPPPIKRKHRKTIIRAHNRKWAARLAKANGRARSEDDRRARSLTTKF